MTKEVKLDEWDCQFVHLWKGHSGAVTLDKLRGIWGKRCAINPYSVSTIYIAKHFLKLAYKLNLFENEVIFEDFIFNLRADRNFLFSTSDSFLTPEEKDFNLVLLSRLGSLFSLTKVKDLPGYREWLDKQK